MPCFAVLFFIHVLIAALPAVDLAGAWRLAMHTDREAAKHIAGGLTLYADGSGWTGRFRDASGLASGIADVEVAEHGSVITIVMRFGSADPMFITTLIGRVQPDGSLQGAWTEDALTGASGAFLAIRASAGASALDWPSLVVEEIPVASAPTLRAHPAGGFHWLSRDGAGTPTGWKRWLPKDRTVVDLLPYPALDAGAGKPSLELGSDGQPVVFGSFASLDGVSAYGAAQYLDGAWVGMGRVDYAQKTPAMSSRRPIIKMAQLADGAWWAAMAPGIGPLASPVASRPMADGQPVSLIARWTGSAWDASVGLPDGLADPGDIWETCTLLGEQTRWGFIAMRGERIVIVTSRGRAYTRTVAAGWSPLLSAFPGTGYADDAIVAADIAPDGSMALIGYRSATRDDGYRIVRVSPAGTVDVLAEDTFGHGSNAFDAGMLAFDASNRLWLVGDLPMHIGGQGAPRSAARWEGTAMSALIAPDAMIAPWSMVMHPVVASPSGHVAVRYAAGRDEFIAIVDPPGSAP